MNKNCHDLSRCISLEEIGCEISERNYTEWIEQEQNPNTLILQIEDRIKTDEDRARNQCFDYITDEVGNPVCGQTCARYCLNMLQLLLPLLDDERYCDTGKDCKSNHVDGGKVYCLG